MKLASFLFHPVQPIPAQYQSNFRHLYQDIAWFGVLSGSAMAFIAVYATRLGASAEQIGLISAAPAVVTLFFALPTGKWLENKSLGKTVFWASLVFRLFYLILVPLPSLLMPNAQIWTIIFLTLVISVPGTVLSVGFNALFADAVPPEWRGYVAGVRNAVFSLTTIAVSLISGQILNRMAFPYGYQVVFGIGFLGAAMSSYHLYFVKQFPDGIIPPRVGKSLGNLTSPGVIRTTPDSMRPGVGLRFLTRAKNMQILRFDIIRGPFGRIVGVLFLFHLAQYLAIPIFPLFMVNTLHYQDSTISLGSAVFYVTVFIGSVWLPQLTSRYGFKQITAIGVVMLGFYPAFLTISHNLPLFLLTSAIGGIAWALAGGALYNYLLERVPNENRPAYLAWYNLGLNAAILLGSLGGPFITRQMGIVGALVLFAIFRVLAGLAILRFG